MSQLPRDLIDSLGVPSIATALAKKPRTIEMWRFRNKVPRTAWPDLMAAFPLVGLDVLRETEKRQGREAVKAREPA